MAEVRQEENRVRYGVYISGLPFKTSWQLLKDYLEENANLARGTYYADVLRDPATGRQWGAAVVRFSTEDEMHRALALNESKWNDATLTVLEDSDNSHVKKICAEKNIRVMINKFGKPRIPTLTPEGNAVPFRPKVHYNDPQLPLISRPVDLGLTAIWYTNLPWETDELEVRKLFRPAGHIANVEPKLTDEGKNIGQGTCDFVRARDAHRAILMFNGTTYKGREVKCRLGRDRKAPPGEAQNLGRFIPENELQASCVNLLNIDPFGSTRIFISGLEKTVNEENLKDLLKYVCEIHSVRVFHKDDRPLGCAIVGVRTGIDGQQAIHILNGTSFHGKKLAVKLERDKEGKPTGFIENNQPASTWGLQGQQPGQMYQSAPGGAPGFQQTYAPPSQTLYRPVPQMAPPQMGPPGQMYQGPPRQTWAPPGQGYQAPPPQGRPGQGPVNGGGPDLEKIAAMLGVKASTLSQLKKMEEGMESNGRDRSPHRKRQNVEAMVQSDVINDGGWEESATENTPKSDTVFLRNLPQNLSESRLRTRISKFGTIDFVDFPQNSDGSSQGYAYVRFGGPDAHKCCTEATKALHGTTVERHKLDVGVYY